MEKNAQFHPIKSHSRLDSQSAKRILIAVLEAEVREHHGIALSAIEDYLTKSLKVCTQTRENRQIKQALKSHDVTTITLIQALND